MSQRSLLASISACAARLTVPLVALVVLLSTGRAPAQSCSPTWMPGLAGDNAVAGQVNCLAVFDDGLGGGPALYVGGDFTGTGAGPANRIVKWDGTGWSALGSGLTGGLFYADPFAMTVHDDGLGGGPALFVGGYFTQAGGSLAPRVAKWDGASWSALGSGVSGSEEPWVNALVSFDDGLGGGPALFVAGPFQTAGGQPVPGLAKWDGANWSVVGSPGLTGGAYALAVFDDGLSGGPALYAGGGIATADGLPANKIAKWNGTHWSPVGGGVGGGGIVALAVHDDGLGGGPALYAGGTFTSAEGAPANHIARWDGSNWSAVGAGMDGQVMTLLSYDDGTGDGAALYAGGIGHGLMSLEPVRSIAKWNGTSWSGLGSGVQGSSYPSGSVWALLGVDAGTGAPGGPGLFAGGGFSKASGVLSPNLARWTCPDQPPGWFDLEASLGSLTGQPTLVGTGTLVPGSPGTLNLSGAKPSTLTNLFVSLSSTPTPFKGGTLLPVPSALVSVLFTNGAGKLPLSWTVWPAGIPSGSTLYFQFAIQDETAPLGVALSNAVLATTP